MALSPRQARFVEEYLVDLNATQAAIRAGYSPRTAGKVGHQLLGKTRIAAAVANAQEERSERVQVTADRVLKELARIGFANISDIVDWKVNAVGMIEDPETGEQRIDAKNEVVLKSAEELSDDIKAAIASVEQTPNGALKLKMHDKRAALNDMARHLGMYAPVTRENNKGNAAEKKVGKKEQQAIDAATAADGSDWGDDLDRPKH